MADKPTLPPCLRVGPRVVRQEGRVSKIGTPLPLGTIVYTSDVYELPDGVCKRQTTDYHCATAVPPTSRSTPPVSTAPDYTG